jgi:hypothetical protein
MTQPGARAHLLVSLPAITQSTRVRQYERNIFCLFAMCIVPIISFVLPFSHAVLSRATFSLALASSKIWIALT